MNGLMNRYNKSLQNTPEPILLSQQKKIKMDLSGLIKYAKKKGVQPFDLSDSEKQKFIL